MIRMLAILPSAPTSWWVLDLEPPAGPLVPVTPPPRHRALIGTAMLALIAAAINKAAGQ